MTRDRALAVVAAALGLVRLFRDVDQDPAAAQDRPGPAGGGPAHRVDHHVHVADLVLEPAGVVENLIGAEPGDEIPVPRRRGSGHPRAVLRRELRDVGADTAGATVDQDVLPGSQLSVLVQRLPGGERAERNDSLLELAAALETLPDDQREAVELHYCQGWTLAQIATHLNRTTPSIAGLVHRGLMRLRGVLT